MIRLFRRELLNPSIRSFCQNVEEEKFHCRTKFIIPEKFDHAKWYPKHMRIQLQRMEAKLRSVDLIVEVHDARIPFTGRNPDFLNKLYAIRPHILVLNKVDLISKKYREPVDTRMKELGVKNILWTDCKNRKKSSLEALQNTMIEVLREDHRFNRSVKTEYQVMVVGVPNVGKSSLINSLRTNNFGNQQKAVCEGARPGVTVRVQNRVRIYDKPPIYILDTPGVLNPYARVAEDSMKLALCSCVLGTTINQEYIADYLLYTLNKNYDYSYLERLLIHGPPTNSIQELRQRICESMNLRKNVNFPGRGLITVWDISAANSLFLDLYRNNKLPDSFLDNDCL